MSHRESARRGYSVLLGLLLSAMFVGSPRAQDATPSPQATPSPMSEQDLAKSVHNPFEDFVKVPFQSATGFRVGPHNKAATNLNVQPVIPFHLNADWDLFARPSLTVAYLPSPHEQYGLQDFQTSFFLSPSSASKWIWGVGADPSVSHRQQRSFTRTVAWSSSCGASPRSDTAAWPRIWRGPRRCSRWPISTKFAASCSRQKRMVCCDPENSNRKPPRSPSR